jgi:hypothetical protein
MRPASVLNRAQERGTEGGTQRNITSLRRTVRSTVPGSGVILLRLRKR